MARLFKCARNHNPLFFQKNTQLEGFNWIIIQFLTLSWFECSKLCYLRYGAYNINTF